MDTSSVDLAVLGGGEAGIAAAVQGAGMGARVVLVEKSPQLGGACVATGTLPSKTFSISAGMLDLVRKSGSFGVRIEGPVSLDFKEVVASRLRLTRCDLGVIQSHLRSRKIQVLRGEAVLSGPGRLRISPPEGAAVDIEAPRIIIASGSYPVSLPNLPVDGRSVITTDEIIGLSECPKRVFIVGAGVIGCEYAFIFRTFGAEVVVVEKAPRALAGQDRDVVTAIEKEMKKRGIRLLVGTSVVSSAAAPGGGRTARIEDGTAFEADLVLVCVGRRPSTEDLGLAAAGVAAGARGEILVDDRLETTAPGIFAAGDVLGRWMQSSTAILEGAVAAENALGGSRTIDERFVPGGIYTQPEVGSVGMTEDEARARGIPHVVGMCPYALLVKSCAIGTHGAGFIKMIFDPATRRLLGAHILGSEAAEIIHNLVVALRLGATAEDFVFSIYHHPSLSEGFREAARDALSKISSPA